MAPIYGTPNYSFLDQEENDTSTEILDKESLSEMAFWYMIVLITMLFVWLLVFFCLRMITLRQKTRNPQRRRMYGGARARPSLTPAEPTIYVSPANLPPPPKYEALAPPSYDEVVGIHYPNYQTSHVQPITAPITTAMAQTSNATEQVANNVGVEPSTVITLTADERRTSVTVARS